MKPPIGHTHPPHACLAGGTCPECNATPAVETHGARCYICREVAWCVYLVQSTDEFREHILRRHGIARGSICRECEEREYVVMRGME